MWQWRFPNMRRLSANDPFTRRILTQRKGRPFSRYVGHKYRGPWLSRHRGYHQTWNLTFCWPSVEMWISSIIYKSEMPIQRHRGQQALQPHRHTIRLLKLLSEPRCPRVGMSTISCHLADGLTGVEEPGTAHTQQGICSQAEASALLCAPIRTNPKHGVHEVRTMTLTLCIGLHFQLLQAAGRWATLATRDHSVDVSAVEWVACR
ncbi:hypothetical protein B0T16DRAFT_69232 [Cercophora newfieldiana]|uniref:Uncharacterized protein n=1 Tax=Cercophora newfieldiana TaxID=92897 RepID=A0AA39YTT6_9PEZI|nr:hypothetical protein B0T16DRAFT_69232 [Cercophora newfieldiana]